MSEALKAPYLVWTTGGHAGWTPQTAVTHDGSAAARSGAITHNQESWLQTTVTGPATVSWRWKVSSESGFDYLEFWLDGVLPSGRISGEVDWQPQLISIGPGTLFLRVRQ